MAWLCLTRCGTPCFLMWNRLHENNYYYYYYYYSYTGTAKGHAVLLLVVHAGKTCCRTKTPRRCLLHPFCYCLAAYSIKLASATPTPFSQMQAAHPAMRCCHSSPPPSPP